MCVDLSGLWLYDRDGSSYAQSIQVADVSGKGNLIAACSTVWTTLFTFNESGGIPSQNVTKWLEGKPRTAKFSWNGELLAVSYTNMLRICNVKPALTTSQELTMPWIGGDISFSGDSQLLAVPTDNVLIFKRAE